MANEITLRDLNTRNRVRTLWLRNMSIVDICKDLGVSIGTWDSAYYLNVKGFRDFVNSVKKEAFICNAEKVSNEIINIDTKNNAKLLSIKQKEAEFLRETLGKDLGYSKRVETIGLNINKNEPLDDEQRKKLDKLFGKMTGNVNVSVEYAPVDDEVNEKPIL